MKSGSPPAIEVSGVAHFGLTVSDIAAAIAFWERFLGTPPTATPLLERPYIARLVGIPDARIQAAFFDLPGRMRLELLSYLSAPSEPSDLRHNQAGHAHVCLWTRDADDAWRWAVECGAEPVDAAGPIEIDAGQHKGLKAAYLRVPPDGHVLELFARPA
jgi:catechol 2,3-dioxygenase-like lactoylglutathione lyase family enzyme